MEGGGDSLLVCSGIIPLGCEWTACLAYSGMHFEPDNIFVRGWSKQCHKSSATEFMVRLRPDLFDKAREHLVSYCLIQEETFFGHVDMDNADAESSKSTSRARESESGPLTPRQRAKTPVRQAAISLSDVRLDQARLDKVCSGWQIWGIITDRCIRISSYLSRNT